jgi:4-amino-4-deoxy-L-arabinose transferase-like glycosyltransferase
MPNFLKYILITCGACLLFMPFLGQVHLFDWDEINFAECAREMIVTKDYLRAQIDFMPFWEKPPFFIWTQVLAMKTFGIGAFAARFPNAVAGVATFITLFYVGKKVVSEKMALTWVVLYAASWLPHFYFKSGIIDPTFNLFIFLSFFQMHVLRFSSQKLLHAVLAGLFLGMAVLTKGPVAILIAGISLVVYMLLNRGFNGYTIGQLFTIAFCALLPILIWLGVAAITYGAAYGKWFVSEFLMYQVRLFSTEDADHGGPFYYHFIVLLIGCFPASVFLFQNSRPATANNVLVRDFRRWMQILFWVVLILFSIVKTKIVHYSSLCYFPLTFLAASQIMIIADDPALLRKRVRQLFIVIGSVIAVLIAALPIVGLYKDKLATMIDDPFVVANLRASVSWSPVESLWGIAYLAGIWVGITLLKKQFWNGLMIIAAIQIIIIQITVLHFTPKIEAISQRAAINFYEGFEGTNVYVHSLGFKSYANLFYTKKQAINAPAYQSIRIDKQGKEVQPEANEKWLLSGRADKPVYFICKVQDSSKYVNTPLLTMIGSSNGFVFFKGLQQQAAPAATKPAPGN